MSLYRLAGYLLLLAAPFIVLALVLGAPLDSLSAWLTQGGAGQ